MSDRDLVFALAIELEERAAGLYRQFARRFRTDTELYHFWSALSEDEALHAQVLRFVAGVLEVLDVPARPVPADTLALQVQIRWMEDVRRQALAPDFSLERALEVARRIELSEMDELRRRLEDLADYRVLRATIREMTAGTDDHAERIEALVRRRGRTPMVRPL